MSGARAVFLTARREIRERAASRVFIGSTLLQVAIVVAIVVVASMTTGRTDTYSVGVTGAEARAVATAAQAQQRAFDVKLEVRLTGEPAARAQVEDGKLDVALSGDRMLTGRAPSETLTALLQQANRDVSGARQLRGDGLSGPQIRAALEPEPLTVQELGEESSGGVAFLASLLLYIAIISYGVAVATGVVQEKASRVVEVILSTIRPVHLLAGKVLGIGLLGLGQLLVIVGAAVAAAVPTGALELPESTASTAVLVGVYFVLGYLVYACMYAISGAIVSSQEDVNSSSAPLTIVLIAGYLVSVSVADRPDSTLAVVASFVPPLAPMIVPSRAAQDALPAGELALSLALMVLAAAALLWLAARVYDRSVLRMGAPLKLREALRLAR